MKRLTFWLVTSMAGIYVLIAIAEAYMYSSLDKTMAEQHELQAKLSHVEQINGFTQQLVHRLVIDSPNDPTLAQILKMNGVKVTYQAVSPTAATGSGQETIEATGTPVSPIHN